MSMNLKKPCRLASAIACTVIFATIAVFAQENSRPAPLVTAGNVTTVENNINRRYSGQLSSPSTVALSARVSGEITALGFKDGESVSKGQMLYKLDDVRYKAAVASVQAEIERCKASLKYSTSNLSRIEALFKKGASTRDNYEAAVMAVGTDQASLHLEEAKLVTALDDLKNTEIIAPISGKMSITNYTIGNYLTPSSGTLATLVQLDPMRIAFSISNRDFLTLFKNEDGFRRSAVIKIRLANGEIYPHEAVVDFINNEANRTTDTIQIYANIPNKENLLVPGSSVTVLMTKKASDKRAAVLPSAILSDNDSSYVYVLDDKDIATRRNVTLGASSGKLQIIEKGLDGNERIVTDGVHKVIPGQKVRIANAGQN